MMNPLSRLGHVWILCFVLILLNGTSAKRTEPDDKEIDRLAKSYRAARTEFERRAVCLEAIDAGVIAVSRPVAVVDAIFGTTYAKKLPHPRELEAGVVDFYQPQPRSNRDDVQVPFVGWYFAFKYDSAGRLENYYLSNLHKNRRPASRVSNYMRQTESLACRAFSACGTAASSLQMQSRAPITGST